MEPNRRFHLDNPFLDSPLKLNDINIVQIGRMFCTTGVIVSEHSHGQWFELSIITKGKGVIRANDKETTVQEGEIYISFPHDIHSIISTENLEFDFYSFYYETGAMAEEFKTFTEQYRLTDNRVVKDERISYLINNAIIEFTQKDKPLSHELLYGIFTQVAIYLLRDFNDLEQSVADFSDKRVLCYQVMNYIDAHIYSLKNLTLVAEKFNYNYSYLSTLFKKTTGSTLFDYFQNRKLKTATLMLTEQKKIGEISESLGYENQFAFSKAFKKKYGVSPQKYKGEEPPEDL